MRAFVPWTKGKQSPQAPYSAELFSGYYSEQKQQDVSTASQINSFHLKQCHPISVRGSHLELPQPASGYSGSEDPTQANQDSVSIRTSSFTLKHWVPLLQPLYMVIPWKIHSAVLGCFAASYEWSCRCRPFVFCLAVLQKISIRTWISPSDTNTEKRLKLSKLNLAQNSALKVLFNYF